MKAAPQDGARQRSSFLARRLRNGQILRVGGESTKKKPRFKPFDAASGILGQPP